MKRGKWDWSPVTLYFFLCFSFILTLKKLVLATYGIEFYTLSSAVVEALIVGKIVGMLDKPHAGSRFDKHHSLGAAALYQTMIYSLCTAIVLGREKLFHAYRASPTMSKTLREIWSQQNRNIILAKVICIGLALLGYHLYGEIDRRLGERRLKHLIFEHP